LPWVKDDAVQTLARLQPTLVIISIISAVAFWLLRRRRARKSDSHPRKLLQRPEGWSQFFISGEETGDDTAVPRFDNLAVIDQAEVEINNNGLKSAPLAAPVAAHAATTSLPRESQPDVLNRAVASFVTREVNVAGLRVIAGILDDLSENGDGLTFDDGFNAGSHIAMETTLRPPLHQLPPPLPAFAGRSIELAELSAAQSNPKIRILSLQGLGGVGKTTLAVKLAHQLAPQYPDAQIYVDLKGASAQPLRVTDALAQIIRAFLPTARLPENETELGHMYQLILKDKWALLLFDNAAHAQQVVPLLPPEGCLSIITSRQEIMLPAMFACQLNCLPASEAEEMLSRLVPRIGSQAEKIAELSGRLPMALRLAAGALTMHPELSPNSYAQTLAKLQNQEATKNPVDAVLQTSYQLLDPDLQKLWRLLAVFSDTFDVNAAASVWRNNPGRASDALSCLMSYSLIERNRANGRLRLHDLMLYFADTRLSDEERAVANRLHSAHYQSVLHEADALYEQGGKHLKRGLALLDLEWHNIQAGQDWAVKHLEKNRVACELCASYPDAGKYVRDLRQHPRERIRWSESALAAAKILKRRKAIGRHLIAIGDSCTDLSETHRAIECYEEALEQAQDIKDRRGEADALSGLGTVHYIGGGLNRARELHQTALEIARSIKDQRAEAMALGNLGMTHYALGEVHTATMLFDQQLRIAREIGDRRNENVALGGLGIAHYLLGNARLAVNLLNQQLTITREIGDRRGEASALCNLGSAYASLNDHQKAVTFHEQSLAVAREIGDRRNEANALGGLGVDYYLIGDLEVATQFFDLQLKLDVEIGDRRGESLAQINLGEAYIARGNAKGAIDLLQKAFNMTSQMGDIQGQANSLFKLALALDKFGDRKQAIAQAETALELFEISEHPSADLVRKKLAEWG
ncbi:MAG: tetratricopeptide repeat protein, partial [Acidobacteria bacterium]|nr:tetratricopeptide repeat protein [Acidobacteriota bacterium]